MSLRITVVTLALLLGLGTLPSRAASAADATPDQLQRLVAPIALYPDALVAQMLVATREPAQIFEADRWLAEHGTCDRERVQAVDAQPWDPSVKALTQFPSILSNMDVNLAWTFALGEAYTDGEADVMSAIQELRRRAEQAGNLSTTSQQVVTQQGSEIAIEPADPGMVFVPAYDPWTAYGAPLLTWPAWFWFPDLYVPGPGITFGVGYGSGFFADYGWEWRHWGCDWQHHHVVHDHDAYVANGRTLISLDESASGFGGGRLSRIGFE